MKMHFCLMVPLVLLITSASAGEGPSCPDQKTVGGICYERDLNDVDTSSYGCNANCTYREMKHSDSDERFCFRNGDLPVTDVCTDPSPETFVVNDAKNMPNINYFTRGYNIIKGNPLQVSASVLDPGFQESIFQLSYEKGSLTPDGKYLQPDGTLISMCKSCSLAFGTRKISGTNAYRKSLSEKASVSVSGEGFDGDGTYSGSFSASVDYKHVKDKTSDHSSVFTHSDASCCAYQIQTNTYTPPPFSQDFLAGVKTLTKHYDKRIYTRFINAFGTHYIRQANMGSLFGQQCRISRKGWKSLLKSNIDIDVAASFSAESIYSVQGSVNSETNISNKDVSAFNKHSSSQTLYTKGSNPPKNGSVFLWAEQTKNSPAPITVELVPIMDLFDGPYGLNVPKEVIDNMKMTLHGYCGKECSEDKTDSDPQFPELGNWMPWITNNYTGIRRLEFSCIDAVNSTSYVTSFFPFTMLKTLFFTVTCSGHGNHPFNINANSSREITSPTNNSFGDPIKNDPNVNQDTTCHLNGFRNMRVLVSPIGTIDNIETYCHDDSKPQYTFSDKIDEQFGRWTDWTTCNLDEKITGMQIQQYIVASGPHKNTYVNDIRIQCE